MASRAIPQGFLGRAEMRAEQARLADLIRRGHFGCIDRYNQLSWVLPALRGQPLRDEDGVEIPFPARPR